MNINFRHLSSYNYIYRYQTPASLKYLLVCSSSYSIHSKLIKYWPHCDYSYILYLYYVQTVSVSLKQCSQQTAQQDLTVMMFWITHGLMVPSSNQTKNISKQNTLLKIAFQPYFITSELTKRLALMTLLHLLILRSTQEASPQNAKNAVYPYWGKREPQKQSQVIHESQLQPFPSQCHQSQTLHPKDHRQREEDHWFPRLVPRVDELQMQWDTTVKDKYLQVEAVIITTEIIAHNIPVVNDINCIKTVIFVPVCSCWQWHECHF